MTQVSQFFQGLFSDTEWPARWHCGTWSDFHGWLYIISNMMIWLAYCLIPIIIINYFNKKKGKIRFHKAYLLFAAFILLCGTTHFFDAMMFWIPLYRVSALLLFVTGIVSLITVYYLVKMLPDMFGQRTNIELENEIALRKETEKKLEIANKNLEHFASIASHDLQEPLRNISMFSSMIMSDKDTMTERNQKFFNKIIKSTDRMQTLIKDVLTLSSLNEETKFSVVNLKQVLENVEDTLSIRIKEKDALLEIGEMPFIKANETYITQLFYNLVNNAIKFSEKAPVIKITSAINENNVVVKVSDNGIGINETEINKIFDPFKRLHSKSEYEGTGLGLAICKKIIDVHHGTISVTSRANEGSTFIITLPLS